MAVELEPLTDEQRQIIRQCADLFFSEQGSVQQNVARVAAAAFRAGMEQRTPGVRVGTIGHTAPPGFGPATNALGVPGLHTDQGEKR